MARETLEAIEGRHQGWVIGGLSVSEETVTGGLSEVADEGRLSEA